MMFAPHCFPHLEDLTFCGRICRLCLLQQCQLYSSVKCLVTNEPEGSASNGHSQKSNAAAVCALGARIPSFES